MQKTLLCLALAAAPFLSHAAESNGIDYNFAELGYVYNDSEFDMQGFRLRGSIAVGERWFIATSYSREKIDNWGGHNSVDEFQLGGGFIKPMNRADWVTQAAWIRSDANLHLAQFELDDVFEGTDVVVPDRIRDHVTGFSVSTGIRGLLGDKLLGHAYLGYVDFSDIRLTTNEFRLDGDVYTDLGLEYRFNDTWGMTGGVMLVNGRTEYTAGVRTTF
jgi:hypothetical protein